MNRFQKISFRSVGDLLDYLPPQELDVVERLREIVFCCIPDAKEKLSYNVPFYYRHARLCYIWPGAVPRGGTKEGVPFGFCRGHLLSNPTGLNVGQRKFVYTKTFYRPKDIDRDALSQWLYEAVIVDEEATRKGKKQKRK